MVLKIQKVKECHSHGPFMRSLSDTSVNDNKIIIIKPAFSDQNETGMSNKIKEIKTEIKMTFFLAPVFLIFR